MSGGLPNFLIVGAPRSGTTSLALWLANHPQVFLTDPKELNFFNNERNWERGLDWYRAQFAGAGDAIAVGEGSPAYMFFPWSVQRMAQTVPDANLIVCLRNPVDRAYSQYLQWRDRLGSETRTFEQAVADELDAGPRDITATEWDRDPRLRCDYLARGRYLPQLERLVALYGRDRLHVVLLEQELEPRPHETFAAVCEFLALDPSIQPTGLGTTYNDFRDYRFDRIGKAINGRLSRWERVPPRVRRRLEAMLTRPDGSRYRPIDPALRRRLTEHFAAGNVALAAWLGRDLSQWDDVARLTGLG